MRGFHLFGICSLLLLKLSAVNSAAEVVNFTSTPSIAVRGVFMNKVAPDQMLWAVSIKTIDSDLVKAAEIQDARVKQLIAYLADSAKIDRGEISTNHVQLSENRVRKGNDYVYEGYEARTQIGFLVTDLTMYQDLWVGLAKLSGISIDSVVLSSSNATEHRDAARLQAIASARGKAEKMAEALGMKIGKPLSIVEDPSSSRSSYGDYDNGVSVHNISGSGGGLAVGRLEIRAKVDITFELL